ncbi:MAG: hypothetical protein R2813_02485 [Flavobacteriales bacterium]
MKHSYSQDLLVDLLNSEEHKLQEEIEMTNKEVGPSEWTIQKILGFSKAFSVQTSSSLGRFEQIKN